MGLIDRETHEGLLEELLNPEIDRVRLTEILQELRTQHNSGLEEVEQLNTQITKLEKDNNDLIISNSKLFRQVGVIGEQDKEEVEQKEFSETITLEELEENSL